MSISSELLTLNNTKTAIRTAINQKGGSVSASDTFASYANAIANLPTGGGNKLLTSIDVSEFSGTTFNDCRSYITGVTIPNTVTTIGANAFSNCSSLTTVTIPNTVTTISANAFNACTGLTSVTIPSGVTSIENYTFNGCSGLTSITIPSSVTTIGVRPFMGCTDLTSITIPSSVTSIGNQAFSGCTGLTSIVVNATTPPTLGTDVFSLTNNCPIYVPAASVATYKAASNWSQLAGRIQAIPTE